MNVVFKWFLVITLVLAVSLAVFLVLLPTPVVNAKPAPILEKSISNSVEVSGFVTSDHTYRLRATVGGEVTQLTYSLGDHVVSGSRLAVVRPQPLPQIDRNDGQEEAMLNSLISEAEMAITHASNEYQHMSAAVNAGVVPRFKLDEIGRRVSSAKAQKLSAERRLNGYQKDKRNRKVNKLKSQTVMALSNGIIVNKHVLNGQQVLTGDPLFSIVSTDELTVNVMMQPDDVRQLVLGQAVQVSRPETSLKWTEKVARISPIIEKEGTNRGLQSVIFTLSSDDRPESTINEKLLVTIGSGTEQNYRTLPIEAVERNQRGYQVVVIDQSKPLSVVQIYNQQGLFSALKHLKCQFTACRQASFRRQTKVVELGKNDINRIQLLSAIEDSLRVVIPDINTTDRTVITVMD